LRWVTDTLYAWNDESWNWRSATCTKPELSPKMACPPPLVHAVMSSACRDKQREKKRTTHAPLVVALRTDDG
jgi:hypothetical protein